MVLTPDQKECLSVAIEGHNLVVLGQAGTGKTFLVRYMQKHLSGNVQVTATTGIAASHFNGSTVHSWAGILDGRFTNEEALARVEADPPAKARITTTDVLIIDEISMLSARLFDQIEHICRVVRKSPTFFGGMQVICVGDFFQLPPVPNQLYMDPGHYAFQSNSWSIGIVHKVVLATVVRQTDTDLVQAINELERGIPSPITNALMASLGRPLSAGSPPVTLYATNFEVDWHNLMALQNHPGNQQCYRATDSGTHLQGITAKKFLALKVGCPVILLKNLGPLLVNGSRGKVLEITEESPVVEFNNGKAMKLQQEAFTVYDPSKKTIIGERIQYPVALAFALTIHKSQGLTLHRCEVHCANIRQPGQLGVAVGRVSSVEGLRVIGYVPECSIQHKQIVTELYESPGEHFSSDLSCCQKSSLGLFWDEISGTEQQLLRDYSEDSDFGYDELCDIDHIIMENETATVSTDGPYNDVNIRPFLKCLESSYAITTSQKEINQCLKDLSTNSKTTQFVNRQLELTSAFLPAHSLEKDDMPCQKQWGNFYASFQAHLNTPSYKVACEELFRPAKPNFLVCNAMMTEIRKNHIAALHDTTDSPTLTQRKHTISTSGYSKIRYVGGRTVAKLKHTNMNRVRSGLLVGRVAHVHHTIKRKVDMLHALTIPQGAILQQTHYPESVTDTFRKQNLSCGLTNINDMSFEFFLKLETKRFPLYEEFHKHGSSILTHVRESLNSDHELFNAFSLMVARSDYIRRSTPLDLCADSDSDPIASTLSTLVTDVTCVCELFPEVLQSYLSVTDNEFRRNILADMGKKKMMEHRKKVLMKTSKVESSSSGLPVSLDSISKDTSRNKEVSHLKLRAMVLQKEASLLSFTKKDLVNLGQFYGVKLYGKKNTMVTTLATAIKSKDGFVKAHTCTEDEDVHMPSTSENTSAQQQVTGERAEVSEKVTKKGKRRKTTKPKAPKKSLFDEIDQDFCAKCGIMYYDEDEVPWIGCSMCDRWWHRTCCGLLEDTEWAKYSKEDANWKCPICNN